MIDELKLIRSVQSQNELLSSILFKISKNEPDKVIFKINSTKRKGKYGLNKPNHNT